MFYPGLLGDTSAGGRSPSVGGRSHRISVSGETRSIRQTGKLHVHGRTWTCRTSKYVQTWDEKKTQKAYYMHCTPPATHCPYASRHARLQGCPGLTLRRGRHSPLEAHASEAVARCHLRQSNKNTDRASTVRCGGQMIETKPHPQYSQAHSKMV